MGSRAKFEAGVKPKFVVSCGRFEPALDEDLLRVIPTEIGVIRQMPRGALAHCLDRDLKDQRASAPPGSVAGQRRP